MLNPRIYRAGFIPLLFVLVLVAFSFVRQPTAFETTFAPDAFDGQRASAQLSVLARQFPDRFPGGTADNELARRVAKEFRRSGFRVSEREFSARTAVGRRNLRTVVGVRPGVSDRQIVVLAHRDAIGSPARAQLSGTVGLLELAHVFAGRKSRKTLVLVSTSGGSGGLAGAREFARQASPRTDAVLVLGDIAGTKTRKPVVVPWSLGVGSAPLKLRRTVERAIQREVGGSAGSANPLTQYLRTAVPLTTGEQGPFLAREVPAVLVQASGERGPSAADPVSERRLTNFGRAVLRTISALDAASDVPAGAPPLIVIQRKVLPSWAMGAIVAALLLPVLLGAVDGLARARRRRRRVLVWFSWIACNTLPFLLTAMFVLLLGNTGLLPAATAAPLSVQAVPLDAPTLAAIVASVFVCVIGWVGLRAAMLTGTGLPRTTHDSGAVCALTLLTVALVGLVWVVNPFAALLLVPAAHLWLLATAPEIRVTRLGATLMVLAGVVPVVLAAVFYATQFGYNVLDLCASTLLLIAGGRLSALLGALLLGCFATALVVARNRELPEGQLPSIRTRGPQTYAGPGSLGGTDSAMRG